MQFLEAENVGSMFDLIVKDWEAVLSSILKPLPSTLQRGQSASARQMIQNMLNEGWLRVRAVRDNYYMSSNNYYIYEVYMKYITEYIYYEV